MSGKEDKELRERCLELAVKARPEDAVRAAAEFYEFVKGDQPRPERS